MHGFLPLVSEHICTRDNRKFVLPDRRCSPCLSVESAIHPVCVTSDSGIQLKNYLKSTGSEEIFTVLISFQFPLMFEGCFIVVLYYLWKIFSVSPSIHYLSKWINNCLYIAKCVIRILKLSCINSKKLILDLSAPTVRRGWHFSRKKYIHVSYGVIVV